MILNNRVVVYVFWASQVALVVKNPPAHARDTRDARLILGVGKIPWRRKWQLTPVFLPGKSHGQRSLVGYSPWGYKKVKYDLVTKQQQFLAPKNVTVWK